MLLIKLYFRLVKFSYSILLHSKFSMLQDNNLLPVMMFWLTRFIGCLSGLNGKVNFLYETTNCCIDNTNADFVFKHLVAHWLVTTDTHPCICKQTCYLSVQYAS